MSRFMESTKTEELTVQQFCEMYESTLSACSECGPDSPKVTRIPTVGSADDQRRNRVISKIIIAWKVLKSAVVMACLGGIFYLSTNFYRTYNTFPSTTSIAVTTPAVFRMPAVTFCDSDPLPRNYFCSYNPFLCQRPENLTEFCRKHPRVCKDKLSNLVIPQLGYHAAFKVPEIHEALLSHLRNFEFEPVIPGSRVIYVEETKISTYVKCYSTNLHLLTGVQHSVSESQLASQEYTLYTVNLNISESNLFYPWAEPEMFYSIHSPFVPVNPLDERKSLKPGYHYHIHLRMEEEHLLPEPYTTNCTDYEASWLEHNNQGPRSQEMCRDLCELNFFRQCRKCDAGMKMFENQHDFCSYNSIQYCIHFNNEVKKRVIRRLCTQDCKPSCLKLKYPYSVTRKEIYPVKHTDARNFATFTIHFKNPEVTVISHYPKYNSGKLFSYIGGLIAYCLGMSVWVFDGIIESIIRKVNKLKTRRLDESLLKVADLLSLHSKEG